MQIKMAGIVRVSATLLLTGSFAACVDRQETPSLTGPSRTAVAVNLTASPDRILHNGLAQSTVTVEVHDENGKPLADRRVSVDASTGSISHVDVVTGADGKASFVVRAPALSTPAEKITVFVTPFSDNFDNAFSHSLTIGLTGTPVNTTAPTPTFTFEPAAPEEGGGIVFDASATTDEGQACGGLCSYSWFFDGLGAGLTQGMVVSRNALTRGSYAVTLTVTDNAGTVRSTTRAVTVIPPPAVAEEE
jgi:hypothetical protein